jgi:hypothetical protein
MSIFKLAANQSGIHLKESHAGLLHKNLGIKQGEHIPTETLKERMAHETDPAVRRRLNFAINARKWRHK